MPVKMDGLHIELSEFCTGKQFEYVVVRLRSVRVTERGVVYVLESRYHGSNQQLHALARVLARGRHISPVCCELRSRRPVWQGLCRLTVLLRQQLGAKHALSRWLLALCLRGQVVSAGDGDIVLGKTPPFEWVASVLAAGTGAKICYLGAPKRVPRARFAALISSPATPVTEATVSLETLPTPFFYRDLIAAKSRVPLEEQGAWVLMIGGNARGYDYVAEFWLVLANFVRLSVGQGIKWLISTSPRSGEPVEECFAELARSVPTGRVQFFPWSDPSSRRSTTDLMLRAAVVLVTEESASMLSEAVNARLPVVALKPGYAQYNAQVTPLVQHLQDHDFILRSEIAALNISVITSWMQATHKVLDECWSERVGRLHLD